MTIKSTLSRILIGHLVLCLWSISVGQKTTPILYPDESIFLKNQFSQKTFKPENITKKPGHYTRTDWDEAIDSTWGMGLPKSQKLQILNTFWETIDEEFACFVNHPDYYPGWWDSLRTVYVDEINNGDDTCGVSRGRFAAIMNYLSMALKDSHTRARDRTVNENTPLNWGTPLLVPGPYGPNDHFGAGLTPLPDSSLLVYKTIEHHPLGLVPGDIILGYDGIPWKILYKDMLEAQLPIYFGLGWGNRWGSSESAFTHSWLTSAGMNWHLFDSLDVVKYSTGDTIRLSVSPLNHQNMGIFCTEQMEIPGVPMPNLNAGERCSYGIIDGTQIGYIYVWSWSENVEEEFNEAVNALMNDYVTTGLIIDFRLDYWGYMHLSNRGFKELFNTEIPLINWVKRCSPDDHLLLCPLDFHYFNDIYGSPLAYYDKPIAELTGPGSFSVGDYIALTISKHPMARTFGKPVTAAFNSSKMLDLGNYWWTCTYSNDNTYSPDHPGEYLMRTEFPVDEEVWLTQDDVAQGHDPVVEAARDWINSQQDNDPELDINSINLNVMLDHGEDTTLTLIISNNGTRMLFYSLTPEIDISLTRIPSNQSTTFGHGGFDNFGYTWIDSEQPHGPLFDWIDISGSGTPVSLADDSFVGPIDIGFEFPFYGNSYSQLYICSNGLITFGSGTAEFDNDSIPDADSPNNFISPWWDHLSPNTGGDILYFSSPAGDYFVLSYVDVPKYFYDGSITFQVILDTNGNIKMNYLNGDLAETGFPDYYTATVGIENADGSDGLEIHYDAPYNIMESLSIIISTDWLAVEPYSGYIAPGEQVGAAVTFNAKNTLEGIYPGNIYLESNDSDNPSINIPCTLAVVQTGIEDDEMSSIPKIFALHQNYPNPFNASTTIKYELPQQSQVTIEIYDILGRKVSTLVDRQQPAGYHQAIWRADDFASGMYFYKLQAGEYSETRKMLLMK